MAERSEQQEEELDALHELTGFVVDELRVRGYNAYPRRIGEVAIVGEDSLNQLLQDLRT